MENRRQFEYKGKAFEIAELTIREMEIIASQYTQQDVSGQLGRNRIERDNLFHSIKKIDGRTSSPHEAGNYFTTERDLSILRAVYHRLIDKPSLDATVKRMMTSHNGEETITVQLRSNRKVTLRCITLEEKEAVEIKGKFTANDWQSELIAKVKASITAVDDQAVAHGAFDPCVEFPLYSQWEILTSAYIILSNGTNEEIPDFLPDTPG